MKTLILKKLEELNKYSNVLKYLQGEYEELFSVLSKCDKDKLVTHHVKQSKTDINQFLDVEKYKTTTSIIIHDTKHLLKNCKYEIGGKFIDEVLAGEISEENILLLYKQGKITDPIVTQKLIRYIRNRDVNGSVELTCPYHTIIEKIRITFFDYFKISN